MNYRYRALLIACAISIGLFFCEGLLGFNLADEGYLWYGAQQTAAGFIPRRDFIAYDPARYYWSAVVMLLRGDNGIHTLWIATALLQWMVLCAALLTLRSQLREASLGWLLLIAAILAVWIIPRHKTFDIAASVLLIFTLAALFERPDHRRFFNAGLALGCAALIGRNHALYGLIGQLGAVVLLALDPSRPLARPGQFVRWVSGLFLGLSPFAVLIVFAPGYGEAFLDGVRFIVRLFAETRTTNLALPTPWPWRVDFNAEAWIVLRAVLLGLMFLGLVLFCASSFPLAFYRCLRGHRQSPVIMAAICLAPPYAYHAFSRAEILHLAQGLFPCLIALAAWLSVRSSIARWCAGGVVLIVSLIVVSPAHPGYQRWREANWSSVQIGRDSVMVNNGTAATLRALQKVIDNLTVSGETFLAVPYWPGAYAFAGRKAPLWEVYALFPRDADFETGELQRIRNAQPRFAIVQDIPLEGNEALRYSKTHPLIYNYIVTHYQRIESVFPDKTIDLYVQPGTTYP